MRENRIQMVAAIIIGGKNDFHHDNNNDELTETIFIICSIPNDEAFHPIKSPPVVVYHQMLSILSMKRFYFTFT